MTESHEENSVKEVVKTVLFADQKKVLFSDIVQGFDESNAGSNPTWLIAL